MKLYHLPVQGEEFLKDIELDLSKAKEVVLISPFVSMNILSEWRNRAGKLKKEEFTLVYDLDNDSKNGEIGLFGSADDKLTSSITWRKFHCLHSKIYYFNFGNSFSLYFGSANLTNHGVGSMNDDWDRNSEIMSKVTNKDKDNATIICLLKDYLEADIFVPVFNKIKDQWEDVSVEEPFGNIKEYCKILMRLEQGSTYTFAHSDYVLGEKNKEQQKVQGLFKTNNNRMIKFHTSNAKTKSDIRFTIPIAELRWFLGDYYKGIKTKRKRGSDSRKLFLVWKKDGTFNGDLTVFKVLPEDIFKLLIKPKRRKVSTNKNSLSFKIGLDDRGFYIYRHSCKVHITSKKI